MTPKAMEELVEDRNTNLNSLGIFKIPDALCLFHRAQCPRYDLLNNQALPSIQCLPEPIPWQGGASWDQWTINPQVLSRFRARSYKPLISGYPFDINQWKRTYR
jgi:hypothetical protein